MIVGGVQFLLLDLTVVQQEMGFGPHLGEPDVSSLERDDALAVFVPPPWEDHKYTHAGENGTVLVSPRKSSRARNSAQRRLTTMYGCRQLELVA